MSDGRGDPVRRWTNGGDRRAGQRQVGRDVRPEGLPFTALPGMEPASGQVLESSSRLVELVAQDRVLDPEIVALVDQVAMGVEPRQTAAWGRVLALEELVQLVQDAAIRRIRSDGAEL